MGGEIISYQKEEVPKFCIQLKRYMPDMFEEVKKNFGFGCMRLPMKDGEVDCVEFCKMVDTFIENGFNYFDTAHGYLDGKSETALRECLTKRYPRDKYVLTNKLTNFFFNSEADVRPFFESQLKTCGVDYFDFYLMHAQSKDKFEYFKKCRAYEQALEFKAEGKIKHLGISSISTTLPFKRAGVTKYAASTISR